MTAEIRPPGLGLHNAELKVILEKAYGDEAEAVLEALSHPPKRYYFRVNTLKSTPEEVYDSLSGENVKVYRDGRLSEALYVEIEGPHTIRPLPKKVIVDKFTAESVLQGAHVYAPGIVNCEGLSYGEAVTVLDERGNPVANGLVLMGEPEILACRRGLAVRVTEPVYHAPSIAERPEYDDGTIYPQSLPAMVTSRVLDAKPGEVIIDFNCSPGGKLSHICQLTGNQALIYGMDRNKKKIEHVRRTLDRLGCRNVILTIQDTRYLDKDHPSLRADRCLIDPPCSALGVLPKVYCDITRKEVRNLSNYQKQFIKSASNVLKPGGRLVYSVCTVTVEECEEMVKFAEEQCGLKLIPQGLHLGSPALDLLDNPGFAQRFHPHVHGAGYFIALFEKSGA
ncbi:MAG: RsmB/NOP family class I SAM-dependent RNA methyltransferase [Candidatus Bathyarchaeia archaeon]